MYAEDSIRKRFPNLTEVEIKDVVNQIQSTHILLTEEEARFWSALKKARGQSQTVTDEELKLWEDWGKRMRRKRKKP